MAGTPFTQPSGGLWPLGKITVTTAGTPVQITANVGTQKQATGVGFARRVRQLIFSKPITTTAGKKIYLMFGQNAATKTNNIVAVINAAPAAGAATDPEPVPFPPYPLRDGLFVPDTFWIDSDENGANVQITAVYA